MPKRSEKRDTAKAEYLARKIAGEAISLKELAEELGVSHQTLRNWKTLDDWDKAVPKRKRGGQPGNQNSKGKRNAAGSHEGAPMGNKNAEKDGAYSKVFFDSLTEEEKNTFNDVPLSSKEALEHEMKVLKFRENKILNAIARYEAEREDALFLSSVTEMTGMEMRNQDTAFSRIQKLNEALYKVQGRIAKIIDSLRSIEEGQERMELERRKMKLMRLRITGSMDVDGFDDEEENV